MTLVLSSAVALAVAWMMVHRRPVIEIAISGSPGTL
jgi:hypothetical protein